MPSRAYGKVTAKSQGSKDVNVLELKDATRIRLLEPEGARAWRQHGIQSPTDEEQFRSVTCPRGPEGRDQADCPLCRKPTDEEGNQRFPISRRFATNVWDYTTDSVKVLIGGPQIFEEFDSAASVGLDPLSTDWIIHKTGSGLQTSYKMVRGNASPVPEGFEQSQLHDLDKYEQPESAQRIFEVLGELGIDYDSLEVPSLTLEEAEQFVMPYGKHKGSTVEQLMASDDGYVQFIYRSKRDQGSYGDLVFIAMHTVLEARGLAEPLDEVQEAPPRPAESTSSPTDSTTAGSAQSAPPEAAGMVALVRPDGGDPTLFEAESPAVAALEAAGWTRALPPVRKPPTDDEISEFEVAGAPAVSMTFGAAKQILASGVAIKAVDPFIEQHLDGAAPYNDPDPSPGKLPADDEPTAVNIGGVEQVLPFSAAKAVVMEVANAAFVQENMQAIIDWHESHSESDPPTTAASASTETPQTQAVSLDPAQATQDEAGRWHHPALDKAEGYATKGSLTQALNRKGRESGNGASALQSATPAAGALSGNGGDTDGDPRDAALERCKNLLTTMPEIQSDFSKLIAIFEEVAGKRMINDFTLEELEKLEERLKAESAKTTA